MDTARASLQRLRRAHAAPGGAFDQTFDPMFDPMFGRPCGACRKTPAGPSPARPRWPDWR